MSSTKTIYPCSDTHVANIAWYEQVKATIPKSRYTLDLSSHTKEEASQVHNAFIREIIEAYKKNPNHTQIPSLFDSTDSSNVSMHGLAVIATYLREKKGLKNLFVCETKDALQVELEKISKLPCDLRAAYIIPVCGYKGLSEKELKEKETLSPETRHIVTIGVEKTGPFIKIVYFEPSGVRPNEFDPTIIHSDAKELTNANINSGNGLLWYLYHSKLDMNTTSVYFTSPHRQRTGNSCETFATRDAVDFLLCLNFFSLIGIKRLHIENMKTKKSIDAIQIKSLPPAFMKNTQSVSAIHRYVDKHPTLALRPFPYQNKEQTLTQSLAKHRVVLQLKTNSPTENPSEPTEEVQSDSDDEYYISVTPITSSETPQINEYNFRRSRKYKDLLLKTCQMLPPNQIREIIAKSLIQAPAKVDQEIRTLNDLRYRQQERLEAAKKIKSRL